MNKDDIERIRREAELAKAQAGPNYLAYKKTVNAVKAEIRQQDTAALDIWAHQQAGYYSGGVAAKDEFGRTLPFMRPRPGNRVLEM